MLTLDYINAETIWVLKLQGYRLTCKGSELAEKLKRYEDELRDHDVVIWQHQPKELQEFWHAYENANYIFNRRDLFYIDDFYKEWIKDPHQFDPQHRPVLPGKLRERLESLDPHSDMIIINYDKQTIGNHHVSNFIKALDFLGLDFDVVEVTDDLNYPTIIIQDDNMDNIKAFSMKANQLALEEAFN